MLHPGRGVESRAGRLADGLGDHGGLVDIINPEFDHRRHARQIEQALRGAQVREGPGSVKIIEARVEHAHDAEMAELRYYTVRRERTLRAGYQHRVTHEDTERLGQLLADDQRVGVREAFGEARERPLLDSGEQVGNPHLALGVDAFQHHALSARAGRDQNFLVERRCARDHVRQMREALAQLLVVLDAVVRGPDQVDVRRGPEQAVFELLAEAVIDGQSHHQRAHARRHAQHGDHRDDGNHSLLALGPKVAESDEQFEPVQILSRFLS